MKVFLLICEKQHNDDISCDAKAFWNKPTAQETMLKEWEDTMLEWEYSSHRHKDWDEANYGEDEAIVRDGYHSKKWKIKEQDLE